MKHNRTIAGFLAGALLCVLAAGACIRMPLYDREKQLELKLELKLELDVDIDIEIAHDVGLPTHIEMPEHMKCCFFDPGTGNLSYTEFVGPNGGAINAATGTYNMLIYNFGTEYIQIRGENNINTMEAFTSDITATKRMDLAKFYAPTKAEGDGELDEMPDEPIIWAPDHLLVAKQEVEIPEFAGESQTIVIHSAAKTIVETYSFEVKTVTGTENIKSVDAFVTNQAVSYFVGKGEANPQPATIYFPIAVDLKKGCLYTTFNTFGKLPGESKAFLHILVQDLNGDYMPITVDITAQFEKPDKHIIVEEPIVVPDPESRAGGIAPTVDPWKNQNIDVPIG